MKRFISTLLVLCMVCSFVPTIGAEPAEASKSGISVVYDWGTQMKTETENDVLISALKEGLAKYNAR